MRTRQKLFGAVTAATLAVTLLAAPERAAAQSTATTMAPAAPWQAAGVTEVLKMFKGGISSDIITSYINNSALSFYLSADNIISLQQQGVPETVVQAMIKRNGELGKMAGSQGTAAAAGVTIPSQAPAPQYYSYSSGSDSFDAALAARQAASYNNYAFAPTVQSYAPPVYDYSDYYGYPYYSPWGWDYYYPGVIIGGGFGRGFDRGFHGGVGVGHAGGFGGGGGGHVGGGGFGGGRGGGHR